MGAVGVVVCAVCEVVPDLAGTVEGAVAVAEECDVVSSEAPPKAEFSRQGRSRALHFLTPMFDFGSQLEWSC